MLSSLVVVGRSQRVKKILLLLVVMSSLFMCFSIGFAAPVEKEIVIEHGGTEKVEEFAIINEFERLIPASVIKEHLYSNAMINVDSRQLEVQFPLLRFNLEENLIPKNFYKNNFLMIPCKNMDGVLYIDVDIAAKVFGFSIKEDEKVLSIKANRYNAFNPQYLKKHERVATGGKILMAWQPTFEESVDVTKTEKVMGLNVISPSWFAIVGEDGLIKNKTDYRYVKAAHAKGYRVWPLITNSFDPALTHKILIDEQAREKVIKQLVIYARLYDFDGINLDFENIYDEDKELLSSFVKEIADALKLVNLKSSIDVTAPSDASQWSTCYDRKALAEAVDYVMLMAYDEHWRTSPVSGSVASIGWVEKGIVNTLKDVPKEKLVLGVPFYMREWQENLVGEKNVKAKTLTMSQAEKMIEDKGIVPLWLDEIGQYYFQYEDESKVYRVWQEEARSLKLKVDLVDKYQLAGMAAWRKGFEKPEVWEVIHKTLGSTEECIQDNDKKLHKEKKKKRKKQSQ